MCWVYPRVCGGTTSALNSLIDVQGLSPRVRGNHNYGPLKASIERSIPACAGEPGCGSVGRLPHKVYPRVCGGTMALLPDADRWVGLSPRVRGNPP